MRKKKPGTAIRTYETNTCHRRVGNFTSVSSINNYLHIVILPHVICTESDCEVFAKGKYRTDSLARSQKLKRLVKFM